MMCQQLAILAILEELHPGLEAANSAQRMTSSSWTEKVMITSALNAQMEPILQLVQWVWKCAILRDHVIRVTLTFTMVSAKGLPENKLFHGLKQSMDSQRTVIQTMNNQSTKYSPNQNKYHVKNASRECPETSRAIVSSVQLDYSNQMISLVLHQQSAAMSAQQELTLTRQSTLRSSTRSQACSQCKSAPL